MQIDGRNECCHVKPYPYSRKSRRGGPKWSAETVQKALQLKFRCGSGYEALLDQGLPYPSEQTLRRRMSSLDFKSGILEEVFNMMKFKARVLAYWFAKS